MNGACSYGEERLAGLLYEDGDAQEMVALRAHLATCAGCRTELEGLVAARELLSAWPNAVNAPRMVYVNERVGVGARLRRWAGELAGQGFAAVLWPAAAVASAVLVVAASTALLDVRVAPDGRVQIGLAGGTPAVDPMDATGDATGETAAISRDEFQEGMAQTVAYLEELFQSRSDDERRLLVAAIDERMQQQGLEMSQQFRGAVDAALTDMQQQHENDLGLVFSAVDELGVIAGMELQRMNTILASLVQRAPDNEE